MVLGFVSGFDAKGKLSCEMEEGCGGVFLIIYEVLKGLSWRKGKRLILVALPRAWDILK